MEVIKIPNWAEGEVRVSGKVKDVEAFCKLFLFEEDIDKGIDKKYFARSFTETSWNAFKKKNLGRRTAEFPINFAYSACCCIIEGYPNGKECITLIGACKKYKVNVVIDTAEPMMCFEEHIECTSKGALINESKDMQSHTCKCGSEQMIPSAYNVVDEECGECGLVGKWR